MDQPIDSAFKRFKSNELQMLYNLSQTFEGGKHQNYTICMKL